MDRLLCFLLRFAVLKICRGDPIAYFDRRMAGRATPLRTKEGLLFRTKEDPLFDDVQDVGRLATGLAAEASQRHRRGTAEAAETTAEAPQRHRRGPQKQPQKRLRGKS